MNDLDQCTVVCAKGEPATVRHGRHCAVEYCAASYQCEQLNRRARRYPRTSAVVVAQDLLTTASAEAEL
jgi:hypothetical protein